MKTESNLEKVLAAGHLAVTSECGPPRGAVAKELTDKAKYLEGVVDAVNVTDNQTAMVRMSSLAGSVLIKQQGMHPLLQVVTRDRNRLAIQADVLGAYALGI
ncbi:MAG: methylenetetrahydrofolate reductase, partial [Deltaproteobacteria bacterium]|nr:methylenetetrahydrofolate reductase [Deltaproteobacteria bacterium]